MTRKQKKTLARIIIAGILLIAISMLDHSTITLWLPEWLDLPFSGRLPGYDANGNLVTADYLPIGWLYLIPYLIIGWDILWKAVRNIGHGQIFDENFLMSIATIGAFVLGESTEAVGVMLVYQVGELFQSVAVGKSRRSIAQLMDIRPDTANAERDGEIVEVDPEEVAIG